MRECCKPTVSHTATMRFLEFVSETFNFRKLRVLP